MKIKRISDSEIAAYLSSDDAAELGIRTDRPPDPETAALIASIARSELGFGYSAQSCTLDYGYADGVFMIKMKKSSPDRTVMCFADGNSLRTACSFLCGHVNESSLYGGCGEYYLLIAYDPAPEGGVPYRVRSALELCFDSFDTEGPAFIRITEHNLILISENAVNDIAKSEKKW